MDRMRLCLALSGRITNVVQSGAQSSLVLQNDSLNVTVHPNVGGKIGSIRQCALGADLLVPPQRPLKMLAAGSRWTDHDTSGMDDCFPNIEQGPHPDLDAALPQLGEWVYGAWKVRDASSTRIALERRSYSLPYFARRGISLPAPDTLRVDYTIENTGADAFSYMWSAHPLIVAGDEFEIVLPGTGLEFVTYPHDGVEHAWPNHGSLDLSTGWLPEGRTLKIFVRGVSQGWCELRLPAYSLRFDFDPVRTPVVGVWFNNFGFPASGSRFRCIAVEPCTADTDALHLVGEPLRRLLQPRQETSWWMSLRIIAR